jgi:putative AdoMet-dependent methyltransferase
MSNSVSWQYDEVQQIGTDYGNKAEVDIYDKSHASFRDIVADSIKILDRLEIKGNDSVIDFGAGTGTFVIQAAKRCAKVYAVDVSQAMLDLAESKATQAGLSNVRFHHSGFLTYEHVDQPVDAVFTTFAFHHLPDFWKGIALKRLNRMLIAGGQLYIHDVIIAEDNAIENIDALIERLSEAGGQVMRDDTERHFREEYSTYEWVMDGLLSRSGFTIKSKRIVGGVLGTYICTKR